MAIGTEDFLYKENQIFRHFLEEEKIDFEYHESTGVHDFVFWNANIEPAVRWLLGEGIGACGHPSELTQQKMAKELVAFIQALEKRTVIE